MPVLCGIGIVESASDMTIMEVVMRVVFASMTAVV